MKQRFCILTAILVLLSLLAALPTFALDVPISDDGTNSELDNTPIDRTLLDQYVEEANSLVAEDYRGDTWRRVRRALEQATYEFTNQSDVDTAAAALRNALDGLVFKTIVDAYDNYLDILNECSILNESDYTERSWAPFKSALRNVQKTGTVSSYKELLNAKSNLIRVSELKTALSKIPENREEYINEEAFWRVMDQLIERGYSALNDYDIAQKDIDEITDKIYNLIEELKLGNYNASDIVDTVDTDKYSDLQNAWDNFVENKGTGSPFADQNNGNADCQSSITAPVAIFTAVIALGAGVTFKKKKD